MPGFNGNESICLRKTRKHREFSRSICRLVFASSCRSPEHEKNYSKIERGAADVPGHGKRGTEGSVSHKTSLENVAIG